MAIEWQLMSQSLHKDVGQNYSQVAFINGKPWLYGMSGETQCCGASSLLGPQYFDKEGFLQIVKSVPQTIFLTNGYHDTYAEASGKYNMKTIMENINTSLNGIATFTHTSTPGQFHECIITIDVHDIHKWNAWKLA